MRPFAARSLALLLLCAPAALAEPAPGTGALLVAGDGGSRVLPVLGFDVDLEVSGVLVHGTLRQRFRNPGPETLEATYVFPLPENASVHAMEIRIGERRIEAAIREREAARREYEQARHEGRKAALAEQQRPNLFSTAVANVNPGEIVEVRLEYLQELEILDGRCDLTFPLTFVPRHDAGGEPLRLPSRPMPDVNPALRAAPPTVRIVARVRPGLPLEGDTIRSPSHEVTSRWDGEVLVVETVTPRIPADRDFRLEWAPLPGLAPRAAALVEDRADGRYVLLMLLPPEEEATIGLPTETLFVVDTSGSMGGASIAAARRALVGALDRLRPEDRFNILAFADGVRAYDDRFRTAGDEEVEAARAWVHALEAGGGTRIDVALRWAVTLASREEGTGRLRRIVFLTDGGVNNEEEVLRIVHEGSGSVRLHALGIGAAPNRWLLREMARRGRGSCRFLPGPEEAEVEIEAFLARLDRPVLRDLRLSGGRAEIYPEPLPDLHAGEPLLASLRFAPGVPLGELRLAGRSRERELDLAVDVGRAAERSSGVAQRWARARVVALLDSLHRGADPDGVREAVVRTSLAYHILTRYTSLVAVEAYPTAANPASRVAVPAAWPTGMLPRGGTTGPNRPWRGALLLIAGALLLAGTAVARR
ncbi:MAG: VIT domain-containing protein [Acidobacteriota bacterium]|jgi:Ca-activated chloride channel family protein